MFDFYCVIEDNLLQFQCLLYISRSLQCLIFLTHERYCHEVEAEAGHLPLPATDEQTQSLSNKFVYERDILCEKRRFPAPFSFYFSRTWCGIYMLAEQAQDCTDPCGKSGVTRQYLLFSGPAAGHTRRGAEPNATDYRFTTAGESTFDSTYACSDAVSWRP